MKQKFSFSKGMRQSISPNKADPDSYYEALNKRIVVDTKSGSAAVTDEPGASAIATIPATKGVYKIEGTLAIPNPSISFYTDFGTINVTIVPYINPVLSGQIIYNALLNNPDIQNLITTNKLHISLSDNKVTIIYLNDSIGGISVSGTGLVLTTVVPSITDASIISLASIRDNLIIFTRSGIYGQIWKCRYNDSGDIDVLTPGANLVYNGIMYPDTTATYEIFDVVGRWDNEDLVKIYWSNTVDELNHINIASKESLGIPIELLSITPDCTFTQPKINNVSSGGLYQTGMVQYGYQLYNLYGAETVISPLSGLVHLTKGNENSSLYIGYTGGENGEFTGKAVSITIDNIDPKFDFIKVIAVYYTSEEGAPEVNVITEGNVPTSKSITIIDAGDTVLSVYTPAQLNSIGTRIFSPKLLTTKDNYLIAGNYKDKYFDVDEELGYYWDARAYRFPSVGNSRIKYVGEDSYTTVDTNFLIGGEVVPEQHDCHLEKSEQYTYKYQSGGGKLGGSGSKISYEFLTRQLEIMADNTDRLINVNKTSALLQSWGTPTSDDFIEEGYSNNNSFTNYASPVNHAEVVGYQRDELYRFGIVFFNGKGRQSFVKWIGDIKMPSTYEKETTPVYYRGATAKYTYDTYVQWGDSCKAIALGLQFNINTTDLPEDWSYAIVRARREDIDKTILAQGTVTSGIWNAHKDFIQGSNKITTWNIDNYNTDVNVRGLLYFYSPETTFNKNLITTTTDKLRNIYDISPLVNEVPYPGSAEYWRVYFPYIIDNANSTKGITDSIYTSVDQNLAYTVNSGLTSIGFNNFMFLPNDNIEGNYDFPYSYAGSNLAIGLEDQEVLDWGDNVIVNYERDLVSQYGGFKYIDKQNTIYQLAGKLRRTSNTTSRVFGGDTYIEMFDCMLSYLGALQMTSYPVEQWRQDKHKSTIYLPVETTINLALRHDTCVSKNVFAADSSKLMETVEKGFTEWPDGGTYGAYPSNLTDLYLYNTVYSKQPTGKTYAAKPFNFVNQQDRDCEVVSSEKNINGETVDSWTKFLFNNKITVNTANGPLSKLLVFRNQVMFWQDKAFGQFGFNDRKVLTDPNGTQLILGVGSVLEYYQYLSEMSGTKFTRSVVDSGAALYWYDHLNHKMMMSQGGKEESISDIADCAPLFKKSEFDNPYDVIGTFDKSTRRVLETVKSDIIPEVPAVIEYTINYGLLYNWYAATDARNITSAGDFAVPVASDFHTLLEHYGATEVNDPNLGHSWNIVNSDVLQFMDIGSFWSSSDGTNTTNLSFRGGGVRSIPGQVGKFFGSGMLTSFIARDLLPTGYTKFMMLFVNGGNKYLVSVVADTEFYHNVTPDFCGHSIRLTRPATEAEQLLADGTACAPYIGNDGKSYPTVKIGTQVWTAANSAETKYRNGDYIPGFDGGVYTPISNEAWAAATTAMCCAYEDNLDNAYTETVITPSIPEHISGITIGFNERLQAFESLYSYVPNIAISHDGQFLAVTDVESNKIFKHNDESIPNEFYGESPTEGYIKIIAGSDDKKVFTNVEFNSVSKNSDTEYPLITVDNMKLENSYLESDKIELTSSNLRRRFRTWRMQLPKTVETPSGKSRYMDYYLGLTLYNTPTNNANLRLEDVTLYYLIPML